MFEIKKIFSKIISKYFINDSFKSYYQDFKSTYQENKNNYFAVCFKDMDVLKKISKNIIKKGG